jgi:hypothetical protein
MSQGIAPGLIPNGHSQLTSLSSAVGLGTIPADTRLIAIQAETQPLRWRDDGTNPTSSVGMIIAAGDILWYDGAKPGSLKLIETASSAKANLAFYK